MELMHFRLCLIDSPLSFFFFFFLFFFTYDSRGVGVEFPKVCPLGRSSPSQTCTEIRTSRLLSVFIVLVHYFLLSCA